MQTASEFAAYALFLSRRRVGGELVLDRMTPVREVKRQGLGVPEMRVHNLDEHTVSVFPERVAELDQDIGIRKLLLLFRFSGCRLTDESQIGHEHKARIDLPQDRLGHGR